MPTPKPRNSAQKIDALRAEVKKLRSRLGRKMQGVKYTEREKVLAGQKRIPKKVYRVIKQTKIVQVERIIKSPINIRSSEKHARNVISIITFSKKFRRVNQITESNFLTLLLVCSADKIGAIELEDVGIYTNRACAYVGLLELVNLGYIEKIESASIRVYYTASLKTRKLFANFKTEYYKLIDGTDNNGG